MSDFNGDDYEFAAGAITGIRSWRMDDLGRLHGVTHPVVWTPGENVAVCKADVRVVCPAVAKTRAKVAADVSASAQCPCGCGLSAHMSSPMRFWSPPDPCGALGCNGETHPGSTDHTFDPSCQCGFWAYDEHSFDNHGDVVGLIEGYGKTTIGTKGFRCEKARIIALCREGTDDEVLSLSAWLRLQQLYPAVVFYDEFDEMVTKHGAVLRTWPEVGQGFWDQPVAKPSGMMTLTAGSISWNGGTFYNAFGQVGP